MNILFSPDAWEDYRFWLNEDKKTFSRINVMIEEIRRQPFTGTGKPEPLRGSLKGFWSRRITREHRLVYKVEGKDDAQTLELAQLRYHY